MGCVNTISYHDFPKQSEKVGRRVEVCYHFDISEKHTGTVVRDDLDDPCETIIKLDNGRYLRGTECQFCFL